jgi:hypothetical protein
MRILAAAATALPLILTSFGLAIVPATPSYALPTHSTCVITTYYNNASFDQQVGERTRCTGSPVHMTGHTSPYHTTETVSSDTGGGGHTGGGGGSLPCEFLQAGCSNLPVNRFN